VSFTVAVAVAGLAGPAWLAWVLLGVAGYRRHGVPALKDTVSVLQLVFATVAGAGAHDNDLQPRWPGGRDRGWPGPERDRGRQRYQHDPPVEDRRVARLPQRPAQPGGQFRQVGGLAEQDRAGVADQAGPVSRDLMGMVLPVMLHGEERSNSGD
jgi:hypothetical protein